MKTTFLIMIATLLVSCGNKKSGNADSPTEQLVAQGEMWLKQLFACDDDANTFCFPQSEDFLTERYEQYSNESFEIFEYPNFETQAAQDAAEKAFKAKWKDIYPDERAEWSVFGRGNGDVDKLKNVTVIHTSGLEYTVVVDYGDGNVFSNHVRLVQENNTFKIDYMKTNPVEK